MMEKESAENLMTVKELAKFLNVKVGWVYQATFRRELPCIKLGGQLRFDQARINEWLKTKRRND
jgi:excisionase family DNA binding protein